MCLLASPRKSVPHAASLLLAPRSSCVRVLHSPAASALSQGKGSVDVADSMNPRCLGLIEAACPPTGVWAGHGRRTCSPDPQCSRLAGDESLGLSKDCFENRLGTSAQRFTCARCLSPFKTYTEENGVVSAEVGHFPADAARRIAPWGAAWGPAQSAGDEGVWRAAPFTGKPQESACRGEDRKSVV